MAKMKVFLFGVVLAFSSLAGPGRSEVAANANDICPILVGQTVPAIAVKNPAGEEVSLNALLAEKPTLLIVFRGGWCPFCTRHLAAIGQIAPYLQGNGIQIIAISADKPELVAEPAAKMDLGYTLLSDNDLVAAKALGLAFQVEESLVSLYKNKYNIDLEKSSGRTHHVLPVPAAFLIGTAGKVAFSYVNPDYKARVDVDVLKAAAASLVPQKPIQAKGREQEGAYVVGENIEPPTATHRVPPQYPEGAKAEGIEGSVVLKVLIDEKGHVETAQVVSVSPRKNLGFEDAAVEAVTQWTYEPSLVDGHPVKVWWRFVVHFTLK